MNRTSQQQTVIDRVIAAARAGKGDNFCMRARAGTGKTASIMELIDDYSAAFPQNEITYCAFNTKNAKEGKEKLEERGHTDWRKISSSTIHSLGNGLVKFAFKSDINKFKVRDIIEQQNGDNSSISWSRASAWAPAKP
jgi:Cdc6-like AAA superfamily ATPase